MTVEDQLRQAMADHTAGIGLPADRWSEIEAEAAAARRVQARQRARRRTGGLTMLAVATTAAAALIALPALTHDTPRRVAVTPANRPATVETPQPAPPTTVTSGVISPTSVPGGTANSGGSATTKVTPTTVPAAGSGYQPLYPFRTLPEANAWQASHQATGVQPWHLDPGMTALSFTGFLGYADITTVYGVRTDSTGAHVTVGFPNPNGAPVNAAVVHLRRFGTAADAPWEVVGTDDTADFSLTTPPTPRYGTVVKSPLTVGGAINGVDESIRVQVLQVSSTTPLGVFCCQPAGNSGAPWSAAVSFKGATDKVLIVAASTGGHLATVERFTVTGVRTSAGSTPGL
ncbi:MAG: hypothetical protein QOG97_2110 [Acidimicrobiaceae bacterium]|nr:hypothetical protein [Acidimicrobiaceae bacterium]